MLELLLCVSVVLLVFVAYTLNGHDVVVTNLLAQFADVNVYSAVAYYHLVAPHLLVNLLAGEEFAGVGVEQCEQLKLLAGQDECLAALAYLIMLGVD